MNKRIVAFISAAFVLGSGAVRGEDEKPLATETAEPNKYAETPKDKAKAANGLEPLPKAKPLWKTRLRPAAE